MYLQKTVSLQPGHTMVWNGMQWNMDCKEKIGME